MDDQAYYNCPQQSGLYKYRYVCHSHVAHILACASCLSLKPHKCLHAVKKTCMFGVSLYTAKQWTYPRVVAISYNCLLATNEEQLSEYI